MAASVRAVGSLPRPLSSFIGREDLLADAARLLGDHRLLTLTGPGGSGKTRVAIELATRVGGKFPDGVHFVPLAAIRDPALIPSSVARSLGLPDSRDIRSSSTSLSTCATAQCWSSSTTSSSCWRAPPSSPSCWPRATPSGSWSRVARHCTSRVNRSSRCRPSACPRPDGPTRCERRTSLAATGRTARCVTCSASRSPATRTPSTGCSPTPRSTGTARRTACTSSPRLPGNRCSVSRSPPTSGGSPYPCRERGTVARPGWTRSSRSSTSAHRTGSSSTTRRR